MRRGPVSYTHLEINSRDETYFAYDEAEKAEFLKKLEGQKYTIQRSKGCLLYTSTMLQ